MPRSVVDGGQAHNVSVSGIVAQAVKGSHMLKIDGYSRIKGVGEARFVTSDPLDVGGHRWVIRYYPDGDSTKPCGWIGFFLYLDHSPGTDVQASWEISLLNSAGVQSYRSGEDVNTFSRTPHGTWGCPKFIKSKTLEESDYLNDDCFRVRCDVTVWTAVCTGSIQRAVTVPPSDMHQHMASLLESQVGMDVTFQVGEEIVVAHQNVLAARSPVFMAQLFGPMKEKSTRHVLIEDINPRVFRALLHFVYTDSLPEMDSSGDTAALAQHLLVAADKYGMERLKLICEDRLCDSINTGTASATLELAEQHGFRGLKQACFKFLKTPGNLKA